MHIYTVYIYLHAHAVAISVFQSLLVSFLMSIYFFPESFVAYIYIRVSCFGCETHLLSCALPSRKLSFCNLFSYIYVYEYLYIYIYIYMYIYLHVCIYIHIFIY